MKPGYMLNVLEDQMVNLYNELDDLSQWQSMLIDYEQPIVHRLWRQVGECRVCVHCIFPCEKPLLHPHPWPSAACILGGRHKMDVVHQTSAMDPWLASTPSVTTILEAGSRYEMLSPWDWHSVNPLGGPSVSVMVTGLPFKTTPVGHGQGRGQNKQTLTAAQIKALVFEAKEGLKWR